MLAPTDECRGWSLRLGGWHKVHRRLRGRGLARLVLKVDKVSGVGGGGTEITGLFQEGSLLGLKSVAQKWMKGLQLAHEHLLLLLLLLHLLASNHFDGRQVDQKEDHEKRP